MLDARVMCGGEERTGRPRRAAARVSEVSELGRWPGRFVLFSMESVTMRPGGG